MNLYDHKMRGAETVLINLSNSLNKIGHKVTVLNNCPKNEIINGVQWKNINHYNDIEFFDLAISNNDIKLFDKIKSDKKIVISHSLQSIEKFIRKKQFLSFIKYRPKIVLLSKYHKKNRSKLITIFGHLRLNWAVDDIFLKTHPYNNFNNNRAIFTSKEDRNLDMLIDIWTKLIYPNFNKGELLITPPNFKVNHKSLIFRKKGSQLDLIKDLLSSKVFLIPGHKAELFCLAAEEAKELCLPIVTLGIGSLSERVEHGITGFVAKNDKEFANYTLDLFNNLEIYKNLRSNLIKKRGKKNWNDVSNNLIKLLYN